MNSHTQIVGNRLKNIRHDIDPALVQAQIDKKIADLEAQRIEMKARAVESLEAYERAKAEGTAHRWTRVPEGPAYVDPLVDEWIELERTHYARVRVIELPKTGKRFVLAYGDIEDSAVTSGTGPFKSCEEASGWFLRSGR